MSVQPQPLAGSKAQAPLFTGLTLACALLASPLMAQQSTPAADQPASEPVAATPEAPTAAPAASAPTTTAPAPAAPATTATPAASAPATTAPANPAPETAAPAAATPAAPATAATTPATTAPVTAPASEAPAPAATAPADAQAAPAATSPAETAPTETAPAEPTPAEPVPFAPDENSLLPDAVQRVLAPVLTPTERDPNLPHDLSPIGMFMAADIVVKAVMIGLAFASVATWTVLVVKLLELWRASGNAARARRRIENAATLSDALAATGQRRDPASQMVRAAMAEFERSAPALARAGDEGTKDRVASLLGQIEANASRRIGRGTGVLATIGSTAPFVGLFGTVWGIMNSFISISESQTTNLAIVAPGIAEALLATAIGLVAAIPAVVIYNVFARAITGYRLRLATASAGVQRLVSRDLDFRTEN